MHTFYTATIATKDVHHPKGDVTKLAETASVGDKLTQDKLHESF